MAKKLTPDEQEKIKLLAEMEGVQIDDETSEDEETIIEGKNEPIKKEIKVQSENNRPNMVDGLFILQRDDLPQNGIYYPESWNFAYRSPEAEEVANFSTLNPQDQPGIMVAVSDLIRKCIIIYDSELDTTVSTGEICDAHRIYFLLKIRESYLSDQPVKMENVCLTCHEQYEVNLFANDLRFKLPNSKLANIYDGRIFHFKYKEIEDTINIRIPTLHTSDKLFKYLIKVYRASQTQGGKKDQALEKYNKIFYDKLFLLYAPYLFETGQESISEIVKKFQNIKSNKPLFEKYLEIINGLKLENYDTVDATCSKCESLEEAQLRFPDWSEMFTKRAIDGDTETEGYFD
jgi:hypothetical protein